MKKYFRVLGVGCSSIVLAVIMVISAVESFDGGASAECPVVHLSPETFVFPSDRQLLEIHVRLNIQGEIVIEDEEEDRRGKVEFEVFRIGPSESEALAIVINHTVVDVGSGNVILFQVDYANQQKSKTAATIGFGVIGAVCLLVLCLVFWFVCKRAPRLHLVRCSPIEGAANFNIATVEGIHPKCSQIDGSYIGPSSSMDEDLVTDPVLLRPSHVSSSSSAVLFSRCVLRPDERHCLHSAADHGVGRTDVKRTGFIAMSVLCLASIVSALCQSEPTAQIVIHLAPSTKLNSVRLFFNRHHQNQVRTRKWSNRNRTQLEVYDLESAAISEKLPCYARTVCPYAYIQNLAACDGATGRCVCVRGYEFDRGVCVDVDECTDGQHRCSAMSACQNSVGSYSCQCAKGFFGTDKLCQECSVGCPPGSFESLPCSSYADRICTECTHCEGSAFEVKPCSSISDRQCRHVAHPLLNEGDVATTAFLNEMRVEASSNVYLEDLHNARSLETTYYATDVTQASDFHWDRESGLRVNVGVLNIQLIPKYEDVTHEGDNSYMFGNQNSNEDRNKFQNIVKNYCRNPIPDYYSITLEIYRDRTTAAREIVCDSKDPRKLQNCPQPLKDGETFLHRTLNDACQQMGTFPEPLKQAENSIVCTDGSALLHDVFNQSYTLERPISFPTRKCRAAKSRCDQCLNQPRCLAKDVFERRCCHVECFTLMDCKQMTNKECANVSVECAMGDAYRYTIQPVFQNIKTEFQCHVQHVQYEVLYELFYFIQIPNTSFQTPKVHRKVYAKDIAYQSHGEFKTDFLSVEHSTGLDLKDEFILIGREIANNRFNLTIHSVKTEDKYQKKKIVVHGISPNIFVASVQFERPFDYSTSSWTHNNDCNKNVSRLKSVQRHYGTDSKEINAMLENNGGKFKYVIKSAETAPYLRFSVPGNVSILPFHFQSNGPRLLVNDSLRSSLALTRNGRIWEIEISGRLSSCPGYLGVTISGRFHVEEFFRYDALILCPTDFNLTFRIPNWGQRQEKGFDVRLRDASQSHTIYLTQMALQETRLESEPEAVNGSLQPDLSPLNFLIALSLIIFTLLVVFSIAFVCKEMRSFHHVKDSQKIVVCHLTSAAAMSNSSHQRLTDEVGGGTRRAMKPRLVAGLYFTFWAAYSLGVTFTMFFVIISLITDSETIRVREISAFQAEMLNVSASEREAVRRHRISEMSRQLETMKQRQSACGHYVNQLFARLTSDMEKLFRSHHHQTPSTSIGYFLVKHSLHCLSVYMQNLKRFSGHYEANVTSSVAFAVTTYRKYLRSVLHSDWLIFPQRLFNSSDVKRHRGIKSHDQPFSILGYEADFGGFLEIEELDQLKLWPVQFWERFFNRFPDSPTFNVPFVNLTHLHCTTDGSRNIPNMKHLLQLDRFHSFRFFSTRVSTRIHDIGQGLPSTARHREDRRQLTRDSERQETEDSLFCDDLSNLETFVFSGVLRIVFLVLDAVLLLYRFTAMYSNGLTLWRHLMGSSHSGSALSNISRSMSMERSLTPSSAFLDRRRRPEFAVAEFDSPLCETSSDSHHRRTDYSSVVGQNRPNCVKRRTEVARVGSSDVVFAHLPSTQSNGESAKVIVIRILQSGTLIKFLFAGVVLLVSYAIVRATVLFVSTEVFVSIDCFNVYVNAISVEVNQSNWYVSEEAKHLNQLAVDYYRNHVQSELTNLKGLLEYFNSEQNRLQLNYVTEACSIIKASQVNWSCDTNLKLPQVELTIVPCHFLPVRPLLYSGFEAAQYDNQLTQALTPYLTCVRTVVTRSLYTALVMMTTVLIVHVTASILTYCFQVHQSCRMSEAIQKKDRSRTAGILEDFSRSRRRNDVDGDAVLCPSFVNHNKVVDADHGTATMTGPGEHRTQTTDFKYSETNV